MDGDRSASAKVKPCWVGVFDAGGSSRGWPGGGDSTGNDLPMRGPAGRPAPTPVPDEPVAAEAAEAAAAEAAAAAAAAAEVAADVLVGAGDVSWWAWFSGCRADVRWLRWWWAVPGCCPCLCCCPCCCATGAREYMECRLSAGVSASFATPEGTVPTWARDACVKRTAHTTREVVGCVAETLLAIIETPSTRTSQPRPPMPPLALLPDSACPSAATRANGTVSRPNTPPVASASKAQRCSPRTAGQACSHSLGVRTAAASAWAVEQDSAHCGAEAAATRPRTKAPVEGSRAGETQHIRGQRWLSVRELRTWRVPRIVRGTIETYRYPGS